MPRVLTALLALSAVLAPAAAAQELPARWTVWGRDAAGPWRGAATVEAAAPPAVTVRLELERLRWTPSGFAPAGARGQARLEGRLEGPPGARLLRARRASVAGLAGAFGAAPAALDVTYALTTRAGQRRLTGRWPGAEETLHEVGDGPAAWEERPGDWGRPLHVPATPFLHAATTAGRRSAARSYAAKPQVIEAGPEVAYRLDVAAAARVTASVEGDGGPSSGASVDVDVHLLTGLDLDAAGLATRCVARGDRTASADVAAGPCFVVVDTYEGPARAGAYRLRVDVEPRDGWYERPVARGVTLRTRRYAELFGAVQTGSVLVVEPGARVEPVAARGCQRTSAVALEAGAVAAVNGGFFDTGGGAGCRSVSLLKVDGQLLATNSKERSAYGVDAQGRPRFGLIGAGRDWPGVTHALGGVGRLLDGGALVAAPNMEGSAAGFVTSRHPRTAVGVTQDGRVVLGAVDGRSAAGAGMSLGELGQWMQWLGCRDALNLDGGGSTCLWVRGLGVVNRPSDGQERAVGSILAVFAPPLDRDAVWLAPAAGAALRAGERWALEVAAADPEGAPIRLRLEGAPPGAALDDRGDGTGRVAWQAAWPAGVDRVELRVVAAVQDSRPVARTVTLTRGAP